MIYTHKIAKKFYPITAAAEAHWSSDGVEAVDAERDEHVRRRVRHHGLEWRHRHKYDVTSS